MNILMPKSVEAIHQPMSPCHTLPHEISSIWWVLSCTSLYDKLINISKASEEVVVGIPEFWLGSSLGLQRISLEADNLSGGSLVEWSPYSVESWLTPGVSVRTELNC